jgi:CubicO group peptidase (beta-lactamase class C family)
MARRRSRAFRPVRGGVPLRQLLRHRGGVRDYPATWDPVLRHPRRRWRLIDDTAEDLLDAVLERKAQ